MSKELKNTLVVDKNIICISGNIGSGKTIQLNLLSNKNIFTIPEPVDSY